MSHEKNYAEQGTSTSDATTVSAAAFTLVQGVLYQLTMSVLARQRPDGPNSAFYVRRSLEKDEGGTVTVVVTEPNPAIVETAGAVGWNANVVVSGEQLVIQITGAAGVTIDWNTFIDGFQVGPF